MTETINIMFSAFWEFAFLYKVQRFLEYPKNNGLSIESAMLTVENAVHTKHKRFVLSMAGFYKKTQAICAF